MTGNSGRGGRLEDGERQLDLPMGEIKKSIRPRATSLEKASNPGETGEREQFLQKG